MAIPKSELVRRLFCVTVMAVVICGCDKSGPARKLPPTEAKQHRLTWNLETTVQAYEKVGFTDPAWNEPAKRALVEFANSRSPGLGLADADWQEVIRTNCLVAVDAGCDDPLVRYLYVRFAMPQSNSREAFFDAYSEMQAAMINSRYPLIRKCYAVLRTLDQFYYAFGKNGNGDIYRNLADYLTKNLPVLLEDKTLPPAEVYDICHDTLHDFSGSADPYRNLYEKIEPALFKNWPNEAAVWLLKGEAYTKMAWDARGNGYADTVTEEGWKLFSERLDVAEKSLEHGWQLDPQNKWIPYQMLTVIMGKSSGRDQMETWFQRAMALDTNFYEACHAKLYFLEPKWYGSAEEMLEFGRECAQSTEWGGRVPLILVDAHRALSGYLAESNRLEYWKQPEVWPDLKMAFDRFFELNPDEISWYHNYAWYAYHGEQWKVLNELLPKLGPVNYDYFGGKEEFDKMVQLAKEHAKQ